MCSIHSKGIPGTSEKRKNRLGNRASGSDYVSKYRCKSDILHRKENAVGWNRKITEFAWSTNITITKSNAKKIIRAGRNRWKIENQGFNGQKHWQENIEHACSWNEQAQKNHYLMEQISDFIKQLYEYFYLEKNKIKKLQKIYLLSC